MTTPAIPKGFVPTEVAARVAGLGFRFLRPTDWVLVDLPAEQLDTTNPYAFLPLGICVARYGAVVFTVAARPAFDDGTLSQWLDHFARVNLQDPGPVEAEELSGRAAVGCWGIQLNDGVVLRARAVFVEDGGKLLVLNVMAPDELWGSLASTLVTILRSFELTTPAGATVALCPPGTTLPESTMTSFKVSVSFPEAVLATGGRPSGALGEASVETEARPTMPPAATEPAATTYRQMACAEDSASLDPEQAINARLRDGGVGFVPRVLTSDAEHRCATLAATALMASFKVPFGWHVIDDSKRTLVFDADGKIQVNLRRMALDGRSHDQVLVETAAELRREQPRIEAIRLTLGDLACLGVRNMQVDGASIEQAYLLKAAPDDDVLHVRVTASPEEITRALDLTEVLLRDIHWFAEQSTPAHP